MSEKEQKAAAGEGEGDRATSAERITSIIAVHGHPVHPMLIPFPIAFVIGAFACDLAYWWTADVFWPRMAYWLLAAGLAMGAVAALSGTADFLLVREIRQHVASWSHFILAIMAMAIAAANLALRWADAAGAVLPWGLVLSSLNVIMLGFAGWLGANLVFRHLIGTGQD